MIPDFPYQEAIEQHVERHAGGRLQVFHELVSDIVHLDLLVVPPHVERDYWTVVTSGMSALPMPTPPGREDCQFSELMLCLPASWRIQTEDFADEQNWWPLRLLKDLARLPHEFDFWLWAGHTVPNEDPPVPYDVGTSFCGAMIARPILFGKEFQTLQLSDRTIAFHSVLPLYQSEMDLKVQQGLDALFDAFEANSPTISELFDPDRPNAVPCWSS